MYNRAVRWGMLVGIILVVFYQLSCGLMAQEVGHRLGKKLSETVAVVKTSYLCDLPVLTQIVEEEVDVSIEQSPVALEKIWVKDELDSQKIEVRTLKGSVMTIELKEITIQEAKVAEMEIHIKTKEEGISMWKREDVAQRGPFLEIVKTIRDQVIANDIKIVSDTVSTPLL